MSAAAPWVAYVVACVVFWACFAEDAFIVARYAANLVEGHGLVYNPGERINALTSPAHVFLLAPLQALTGRAVEPYAALMAAAMPAAFWVGVPQLFGDETRRRWFLSTVLAFPPLVFWTIGGLETPLLVLAAFGLLVAWVSRRPRLVLAFAAAAVAARYDAIVLVGIPALYVLYAHRRDARVWAALSLLGMGFAAWLAFCFFYFGDILPTSFYVKNPGAASASELLKGAGYEANFALLLALPFGAAIAVSRHRVDAPGEPGYPQWPLAAGIVVLALYGLSAGIKHMMYTYRLFVPCAAWVAYLALANARTLPRSGALWLAAGLQVALSLLIYHKSLNFNVTIPVVAQSALDEIYEFSTVGARYSKIADRVFAGQAPALRAHWSARGESRADEKPRLTAITAGQPPYELREFYVLDLLAGYRKRCRIDIEAAGHYRQHITWLDDHGREVFPIPPAPWALVTREDIRLVEWSGRRGVLRVSWYFRPDPQPNRLPPTIDAPCLGG